MREIRSILLTGGAGFIGSALARHLLACDGLTCLVVLDKLTYAGRRGNLAGPDMDPRFHFVEGDIADRSLVARLLRDYQIEGVFHLAAESHVDRSIDRADDFIATNIVGTANLLEVCRAAECSLLHCSTDEVYGSIPAPGKAREEDPLHPSSPYAASKASADLLCLAAATTHGQDIVITRCTNNYGPRQHQEKLIPTLVQHALRNQPLPLYGNGLQSRDWIHVDDHCRGMLAAYRRGRRGGIFNFGGHCERTNLGIARNVLEVLGKPESLVSSVPDRPGHDQRYAVDTAKATAYFGWQPEGVFRELFPGVVRGLAANLASEEFAPPSTP